MKHIKFRQKFEVVTNALHLYIQKLRYYNKTKRFFYINKLVNRAVIDFKVELTFANKLVMFRDPFFFTNLS